MQTVEQPCPFCGANGELIERHNPMSKWKWSVDCASSTCGMSGPVESSSASAIAAWNTRFEASLPPSAPVNRDVDYAAWRHAGLAALERDANLPLAPFQAGDPGKHVQTLIPTPEWKALAKAADRGGMSLSLVVRLAVRQHLAWLAGSRSHYEAALALPPSGIAEMVREMCAKVADETRAKFGSPTGPAYDNGLWDQSVRIASAIRSLDLSNKGVG